MCDYIVVCRKMRRMYLLLSPNLCSLSPCQIWVGGWGGWGRAFLSAMPFCYYHWESPKSESNPTQRGRVCGYRNRGGYQPSLLLLSLSKKNNHDLLWQVALDWVLSLRLGITPFFQLIKCLSGSHSFKKKLTYVHFILCVPDFFFLINQTSDGQVLPCVGHMQILHLL